MRWLVLVLAVGCAGEGAKDDDTDAADSDVLVDSDPYTPDTGSPHDVVDTIDLDGDGWAAPVDCDDTDAGVRPGTAELADGLDQDCDAVADEGTARGDDDHDGYCEDTTGCEGSAQPGDCNDQDPAVSPGAAEAACPSAGNPLCGNGVDDDCDGIVDGGNADRDGDGYLDRAGDCDDGDATVGPNRVEVPDGRDNDCDGVVDEGTVLSDDDGDGSCEGLSPLPPGVRPGTCTGPTGGSFGDCDDADAAIGPGVVEPACPSDDPLCHDGVDGDCDGTADDGVGDADGDGFTPAGGDCNDRDRKIHPGASEVVNRADDDCDGEVDEGTTRSDDDGDGFSEVQGDCDDQSVAVNPSVSEQGCPGADPICANGVDDDCDHRVDGGTWDPDHDGYTAAAGDCDEADGGVSPGAAETLDRRDQDCDGLVDEGTSAYDDDGDGFSEFGGDCHDGRADVHPGAAEVPGDGVDQDCDPSTDP